jgi:hypothetical protein
MEVAEKKLPRTRHHTEGSGRKKASQDPAPYRRKWQKKASQDLAPYRRKWQKKASQDPAPYRRYLVWKIEGKAAGLYMHSARQGTAANYINVLLNVGAQEGRPN